MVTENDQHIEEAEADRRHYEQIHRRDAGRVVAQKGLLGLAWRPSASRHVPGHCRLGDLDAELAQLAKNARRAPQWIGKAHPANETT